MHTEETVIHNGCEGKCIKRIQASVIHSSRIFVETFSFEGEVFCEMPTFVVPTKESDILRALEFEGVEIQQAFDAEVTTINIVTQKQIVIIRETSPYFEQFHEIIILAVDISTYCDRACNVDEVGLS